MDILNLFSKFADVKIKKHTDMETKTKNNTPTPQIKKTSIFGDFDVEEYERNLRPYTMEEINAMLDEATRTLIYAMRKIRAITSVQLLDFQCSRYRLR